MTTPTPLAPWQFDLGGFLFGKNTSVPISNIEGLGSPDVRDQDVDNPVGDGVFPGQDFYGVRTVRFEAGIKTPGDPTAAAAVLAHLQRAADAPSSRTRPGGHALLRGRWPGHDTRRLYGRLRRAEATSTSNALNGWIPLDIEFAATDPRWHADVPSSLTLSLDQAAPTPAPPGPPCLPADCSEADPARRPGWITNHGDTPAWPSLTLHGPLTNPRVWNTATGHHLALEMELREGEWVEIETRPGTRWALRNGTTNTANAMTPTSRLDRFTIPPGRSEIGWSGHDPTGTSRLHISWRSAYTTL
jgi:hypothetical protein